MTAMMTAGIHKSASLVFTAAWRQHPNQHSFRSQFQIAPLLQTLADNITENFLFSTLFEKLFCYKFLHLTYVLANNYFTTNSGSV